MIRTHTVELEDVMGIVVEVEYFVEQDEYGPPYPVIDAIWIGGQMVDNSICTQEFLDAVEKKLVRPNE